jgi:MT0933-like antitoxin protein
VVAVSGTWLVWQRRGAAWRCPSPKELGMGFLDNAKEKISDLVDGHSDKVEDGIEKAGDVVDDKTGGKFEDKVDVAQDKTADALDSLDGKDDDLA